MESNDHWEKVYAAKATTPVSWYKEHAERSLSLVRGTGIAKSAALSAARQRLGARAAVRILLLPRGRFVSARVA